MKLLILIFAILLFGCDSQEDNTVPFNSLDSVIIEDFEANFKTPDSVDATSKTLHEVLLRINSSEQITRLELNTLFDFQKNGQRVYNKYYKTGWESEGKWLILATTFAKSSYLLIISNTGVLHDAIPLTHYMPGPVGCDLERREIKRFDLDGEIVLEETYGISVAETDSCERVKNIDIFKMNGLHYFEHILRSTNFERIKKRT